MPALISPSEWFSSTKTSTFVTAPGWVGAVLAVDVDLVPVVVSAALVRLLEDVTAGGGPLSAEHPDAPRASTQASAATRMRC